MLLSKVNKVKYEKAKVVMNYSDTCTCLFKAMIYKNILHWLHSTQNFHIKCMALICVMKQWRRDAQLSITDLDSFDR